MISELKLELYRILRASSDHGRYCFGKIIVEIHLLETYSLGGKINEIHKYFTRNSQGLISVGKLDDATTEPYLAHGVAENGLCARESLRTILQMVLKKTWVHVCTIFQPPHPSSGGNLPPLVHAHPSSCNLPFCLQGGCEFSLT